MAERMKPLGLTGEEIARAVKICLEAYAKVVEATGKDVMAEWVAGPRYAELMERAG